MWENGRSVKGPRCVHRRLIYSLQIRSKLTDQWPNTKGLPRILPPEKESVVLLATTVFANKSAMYTVRLYIIAQNQLLGIDDNINDVDKHASVHTP